MGKFGFVIQARIGSSRLPSKILLPFFEGKSIFDLLIEKLQSNFSLPIILATSQNKENDILEQIASKKGILIYRGSENNVLGRFIFAANEFNIKKIIRICSDNPFLDVAELKTLIHFSENSDFDYVSFIVDKIPSIKTHFGFWTEFVTFQALEKVDSFTSLPLYHEHVTNFIYENPNLFNVHFLEPNKKIFGRKDIRMTLDTEQDFNLLSEIYYKLSNENCDFGIDEILDFLDNNSDYKKQMINQINNNVK